MNNNNTSNGIYLDNGLCKVGYTWFEYLGNNSQFKCPVTVPMRLIFVWSRAGSLQGGHIKVVTLIMPKGIHLSFPKEISHFLQMF